MTSKINRVTSKRLWTLYLISKFNDVVAPPYTHYKVWLAVMGMYETLGMTEANIDDC